MKQPKEYKDIYYLLTPFGLDENSYQEEKRLLSIKFQGEPSTYDICWSLFNKLIPTTEDNSRLSMIYKFMADLCDMTDRNPFSLLYEEKKFELKNLLDLKIYPRVRIIGDGFRCKASKALHNKTMPTVDALNLMPLPSKDCTNKCMGKFPKCVCYYEPDD